MRTELIAGEIIVMSPEYRPPAFIKDELQYRLRRALEDMGSDLHPASGSVALSDTDMPLPDIVLTREPRGPGAIPLASVGLLVEVSSTTLARDFGAKLAIYAAAGIPEYWIVDVQSRRIHQFWSPSGETYDEQRDLAFGSSVKSDTIAGLVIGTATL